MSNTVDMASMHSHEHSFRPSDEIIGFDKASRLLIAGCSCLLIVLIFGIILCRLDMSAGRKRRAHSFHQVES
ncbi:unnamed protein product [Rotaria sordida]|uniref:Uncharacterized protein n=1 Tax=Rotaria sordida TaxID=392033 RepID=A0A813T4I6_9BILA|nr:unnamed protein product [Rotaria sordida]